MKDLLLLLILLYCQIIQVLGVLEWTVVGKVTEYGQNATLFCHVPNCCPKDSGWDRWTPVQRTLFIDIKTGRPNKKYDGKVLKDGYTLIIQNLTEQDLNVSYSCLYGVTLGERKFLLVEDVFTHIRTVHTGKRQLADDEIAGIVAGVCLVIVLVTVVCFLLYTRARARDNNNGEASELAKLFKDGISTEPNMKLAELEIPNQAERKKYLEAIQSGLEVRQYVRIQVVGKGYAGKTSLVRRLLGETTVNVNSTDGIDIVKKCKIRTSDGKWIIMSDETDEMDNIKMRILQTVNMKQGSEESYQPEVHELETELTSNSLKRNTSEDIYLPAEQKEIIPLQADENTARSGVSTTNTDESLTNYTHIIPSAANHSQYKKELNVEHFSSEIADKHSTKKPEEKNMKKMDQMLDTVEDPNPKNSIKDDEITKSIIKNMDDILLYVKNKKDNLTSEGLVECGIWDFAGQKDYYATHQTFFTQDAIYLLVADIMEDVEAIKYDHQCNFETSGEYVDFWLDSIHCFYEDVQNENAKTIRPAVIMVCTGIDKDANADKKIKEYESNFLGIFGKQPKGGHIRGKIHFISNITSSDKDFENLKENISKIAKEMHYFVEVLPTKWIQLENALAILRDLIGKEDNEYCVKWESIYKLATAIPIDIDDLLRFLNYQHTIGNIIFFEDKRDYIILQPKWLVNCFKCLVCDPSKYATVTNSEMYELIYWGRLSDDLIDKLFAKEPELKFGYYKKHILDIMGKFDIIVKPEFTDSYYMPCMINKSSTLEDLKKVFKVEDANCTPWLVLEFTFLPISFYYHILFSFIRQYKVCKAEKEHPALYTGKAVISLDASNCRLLIICFSKNAISLQIWKWNTIEDMEYANILKNLCIKIEELAGTSRNNICYEIKAKCSIGDYSSTLDRLGYKQLTQCKGGEYRCQEHTCQLSKQDLEDTWLKHAPAIEHEIIERKKKRDKEQREKTMQREAYQKKLRDISNSVKRKQEPSATSNEEGTTTTNENVLGPQTKIKEQGSVRRESNESLQNKFEVQRDLKDQILQKKKLQRDEVIKSKDTAIKKLRKVLEHKEKEIGISKKFQMVEHIDEQMKKRNTEIEKHEKDRNKEIEEKNLNIMILEEDRKNLHNQIQELQGNIRVFCRVRPFLRTEVHVSGFQIKHITFPYKNTLEIIKTKNGRTVKKKFRFDKVFNTEATQRQVYEEISQLVQSALDGYNVCIFAYGQTGSGKTYTMEGMSVTNDEDENRGIIPRSVQQIFDTIKNLKEQGWDFHVDVSCLEIYGNHIHDLLWDDKVGSKETPKNIPVSELIVKRVTNEQEVYCLLQKASENRAVATTKSNESSSRCHSVLKLKLTGKHYMTKATRHSVLDLVDLAGSERKKKSNAVGKQLQEASDIDKSLTVLGRVLRAITNNTKSIPYRDSKLTLLLQSSIGGNSKTLMFLNISPREDCVDETLNSLQFATEVNECNIGTAQQNK